MSVRTEIISALENNKGEYVSGASLAEKLGVSRNAIWKNIKILQNEGYMIDGTSNKGYKISDGDIMSIEGINSFLDTQKLGGKICLLKEADSTNTYAKNLAANGAEHGTVVISERQTDGRGRMGRNFYSPFGTGIYMSIIIRPQISMETAVMITSCAAAAAAAAVDEVCGTDTKIKWVNDLFLNGKKFCGILTEASIGFEMGQLEYAVIGIGMNVFDISENLSDELSSIVTSIEKECGRQVSRNRLIAALLGSTEKYLSEIETLKFMDEYRKRSFIIGENVVVTLGNCEKKAVVLDIDSSAGLVVRYDDGSEDVLNSGEARIIPCKKGEK